MDLEESKAQPPPGRVTRHQSAVSRRGPIPWRGIILFSGSIAVAFILIAGTFAWFRNKGDKIGRFSAAVWPNNQGVEASNRGRHEEARRHFDEAIKLCPEFAPAWANRGGLRIDLGDLAGGDADLTKALQLDDSLGHAWARRAEGRAWAGRLEEAAADAESGVAKAPANGNTWRARGVVRRLQGNAKGAVEDFDRSLSITPSSFTLLHRGLARRELSDDPGAKQDFEAALELDDRFAPAWTAWSRLMLDAGKADKAETGAAKALAVWPDDPESLLAHAEALLALDRRMEARTDLKRILSVAPKDSEFREEAARLLKEIELR